MSGPGEEAVPASAPMAVVVRVAIVGVTLGLFFASSANALLGRREIAVLLALAAPLGISAWGFARAGYAHAAIGLLSCVLITVVTLVLVLNPLGMHDLAVTAYTGVVLMGALLLPRRGFLAVAGLALGAVALVFALERSGLGRSLVAQRSGWLQLVEFFVVVAVFATIGRVASEQLMGCLGDARTAAAGDPVTGLAHRAAFVAEASARLAAAPAGEGVGLLVMADLEGFRRVNAAVGHRAADAVLREAARRVREAAGGHLVARVGDDEFAVLAAGLAGEAEGLALACAVAAALDFEFAGVAVRATAGEAWFPRDGHGIEPLMLCADAALARAKAQRGGERPARAAQG